jgi:lipopolysaccharide export system permease protein
MLPGLLLYLSYMIFLMLGRGLIEDGKIPGSVGLWWVHGLFAALAIWQYSNPHASKRNKSRLGFGK